MKIIDALTPDEKNSDIPAYKYQLELTKKLDDLHSDFNHEILNEIVLWKVNRYVKFEEETIHLLNKTNPKSEKLDEKLTNDILNNLLREEQKGIQLAMASTILRFRNPKIYQILDQRVYRFIYGKVFKKESKIDSQIKMYLKYLNDLKEVCEKHQIDFKEADRILYSMDKLHNKDIALKNY